jgi:fatty-acyl-CoA synthase
MPVEGLQSTTSNSQLNVIQQLEHAAVRHRDQEVVTDLGNGTHAMTYADMMDDVRRAGTVLEELGIEPGDVVGIAGYPEHRAIELTYAISGIGAAAYPVNVDLPTDHQAFCIDHVQDNAPFDTVFVDRSLFSDGGFELDREAFRDRIPRAVVYGPGDHAVEADVFSDVEYYRDLVEGVDPAFEFPEIDEDSAAFIMFTSGTTGTPKAMAYSHRSMYLHNVGITAAKGFNPQDNILMVPPLFHIGWNLWGVAPLCGAKLVLPGYGYPDNIVELVLDEDTTFAGGVPTLFRRVANVAEERNDGGDSVDLAGMEIMLAGQASPIGLLRDLENLGATTSHSYSFTESAGSYMSLNLHNQLRDKERELSREELLEWKSETPGYLVFGVDAKLLDPEDGTELPQDGETAGEFAFRAPWGTGEYWGMPEATAEAVTDDGYLKVGDLVTIDEYGEIQFLDRIKDTVKSGGEWIPSPVVEELVGEHDLVNEVAIIAAEHEEWMERPVAVVSLHGDRGPGDFTLADQEAHLSTYVEQGDIEEWWIPDDVVVVPEIPRTSTEKFNKQQLRTRYGDVLL